jgi:WxL domain surface cell wall-binding
VSAAVRRRLLSSAIAPVVVVLAAPAPAWGVLSLEFKTAPALPALPALTLNGQAQTLTTAMTNFAITDERLTENGWNLTVNAEGGSGKSAVFARYCPETKCGSDAKGYVTGGATLAANSLTLNSTGAAMSGGVGSTGSTPKLQCSATCNIDSASAVKIVSAETSKGTWTTEKWSATSLKLSAPTTVLALPSLEVYRVNIVWTLGTGP